MLQVDIGTMGTKQNPSRIALVVLGMHRSGTSALSGTLGLLGCGLPQTLMPSTTDNIRGYFEPEPLHKVHTRLLDSAGSHWADWLPIRESWFTSSRADEFVDEVSALVLSEFGSSRQFLLKDPRICRLMPFWDRVFDNLGISTRYVHIHRDPLEVAASLKKRDAIDTDLALLIWLRHVLDSEAGSRGRQRCFTTYNRLLESWRLVAGQIEHTLKLTLPRLSPNIAGEVEAFLGSDLRHHVVAANKTLRDPMVLEWVRSTYEVFERWADNEELSADHMILDQIRADMNKAGPIFARVIYTGQINGQSLRLLTVEKGTLEQKLTGYDELKKKSAADTKTIEQLTEERRQYPPEDFRDLQTKADKQTEEIVTLKSNLDVQNAEIEMAEAQHHDREKALRGELEAGVLTVQRLERRSFEANDEIAELKQIIIEKKAENATLRASLDARDVELKMADIRHHEREEALRGEVETGALNVQRLERRCAEASDEISELTRIIIKKEAANTTLQANLNAHNQRLEQRNVEANDEIAELKRLIIEKEAVHITLRANVDAHHAVLETAEARHHEREEALRGELETGALNVQRLERRCAEASDEITELTRIILEKEAAHAKCLAVLDDALLAPGQARSDAQIIAAAAALRQNMVSLRQQNAEQANYISALLDSTSWKITAPMRRVVTILRKAARR